MRRSAEFARAFRGVRGGSARLLVAIGADPSGVDRSIGSVADSTGGVTDLPPKVGFVIPRSVGNSIVRHRLCRQLRHLMRMRIHVLRSGELVSIRVFPPAKGASFQELAADLDRCIASVRRKESLREGVDEVIEAPIGGEGRNGALPVSTPVNAPIGTSVSMPTGLPVGTPAGMTNSNESGGR